jgi:uncharacterized Zn-binding protein involved in type VI secretion
MPPAARISDMHVCPKVEPGPVPHVGGPTSSGESTVIIGGMPAARVGDSLVCFGGPPDSIAQGEPTVIIGGKPAARLGDSTSHGGVIVAGCPTGSDRHPGSAEQEALLRRVRKAEGCGAERSSAGEHGEQRPHLHLSGSFVNEQSHGQQHWCTGVSADQPVSRLSQSLDCDHSWQKIKSESVETTLKKNLENASRLQKSPSKAGVLRGYLFENKAIEANMVKLDIQAGTSIYKCTKCGADQEVDIIGKNQIAESKSRDARGVKKKKLQASRLKDIQTKLFDPSKKPLAKLDGTLSDVKDSESIYMRRGFEVEIVP